MRAELAGLDPEARGRRAAELLAEGDNWPPRLFTAAACWFLRTPEGGRELARVALADANPGVAVAVLADGATGAEWAALSRVLWGVDPVGELIRLADPDDDAGDDEPPNWGRMVADLIEGGRALADVGGWTLGQVAAIRHRGERAALAPRPRAGESIEDAAARRRRALGIADDEPADPDDPETVEALRMMALLAEIEGMR